jgi:hypothetical protein
MAINPALIGKASEMLVAAELMRRGVEVAHPASDVGVDLLAYRSAPKQTVSSKFVPIQVKARSESGYNFQKIRFDRVPGVVLVHVWHVRSVPMFFIFDSLIRVEDALGPVHALSPSWKCHGGYNVTKAGDEIINPIQAHQDKSERITGQL